MMKWCFSLICSLLVWSGFAISERATLITLGTQGPDVYADGSVVLDGESYALVWTSNGKTFAGFNLDGSLVNAKDSVLLYMGALAKDGRCAKTTFAIAPDVFSALNGSGKFALYLLDTRTFGDSVQVGGAVQGAREMVQANSMNFASALGSSGTAGAFAPSCINASDIPQPKIVGIRIEGDEVVLTVTSTVTTLNYNVATGDNPQTLQDGSAVKPVTGGGTIELRVPKTDGAQFFQIKRN